MSMNRRFKIIYYEFFCLLVHIEISIIFINKTTFSQKSHSLSCYYKLYILYSPVSEEGKYYLSGPSIRDARSMS